MKNLEISVHHISSTVWNVLFERAAYRRAQRQTQLFEFMAGLDELRSAADYDTGSVSMSTCWALYSLANYFRPRQLVEVGTFIGRSALSLGFGVDDTGEVAEIHTCDMSNDIALPSCTKSSVIQYPRTSSTEMLGKMRGSSHQWSVDLVHLDGRLQDQDIGLLRDLCHEDVLVVLDDFEGVEKGVANYQAIRSKGWLKSHLLIYPPSEDVLLKNGLSDRSVTALMVSSRLIRFTAQ